MYYCSVSQVILNIILAATGNQINFSYLLNLVSLLYAQVYSVVGPNRTNAEARNLLI